MKWVWENNGVDTSGLNAASGSFYVYGQNHGTLPNTPSVGAAVVFDYHGGGSADHVAIVTRVFGDGTIETVSGDWNGQNGSEASSRAPRTSFSIARRTTPPSGRSLRVRLLGHRRAPRRRKHHLVPHPRRRQRKLGMGPRRRPQNLQRPRRQPRQRRTPALPLRARDTRTSRGESRSHRR